MSLPANRRPGDDRSYHLRRVEEERLRAERATDPGARSVHLRMAEAYSRLADNARAGEVA